MRLSKHYLLTLLFFLLYGCATPYSELTLEDRDALTTHFANGDADLICSLTSGYGKAMSAGGAVDRQVEFFESGQWSKLAVDVMSIGFGGDKEWFYLGRAAEGLGHLDVAEKYYETSVSKGVGCRCLGMVCGGLEFPEVAKQRLALVQRAKQEVEGSSEYERARQSELAFRTHVSFYQCRRWAKGKASEELRAFMAALAAGAVSGVIAGEIVDTGSVAENAMMGAAIGLSADATSRIYRQIRFPDSENRGKDFSYLFDECMEGNGLYATGQRLELSGWRFTDNEAISLVGLRGELHLTKTHDTDGCKLEMRYFNQHSAVTNPTIEITLFDLGRQSLSEHVVSYPSVFPRKSHASQLEVSVGTCKSASIGYISSAVDQVSGKTITELAQVTIPICVAGESECGVSVD